SSAKLLSKISLRLSPSLEMQQLAVSAKPVVVHVGLHWTSLVVSCLFTLNLVAMPFYFYLHMPIIPVEEEAVPGVNSTRAYVTLMQARYTPRLANQVYVSDVHSGIIALRTDLSSELLGLCDDHKALLVSRIQGSVFFSPSIQAMTIEFVCGKNHTNVDALWGHYYFGVHVANSVLWSSQHGDVSTICYLFDPFVHYWTCSILEFLSRVFLSGYIAHQCWRYFYDPVAQLFGDLRSNPQGKTCRNVQLVIGEPTSLVVSNAWIVLAFTMDILLHPGTLGSATLRLIQPFDVWGGVLGSLYFGRLVWVSYAALWLWNYLYKHSARLSPVSCTVCAWTTTVLGVVLTKIDFIWTLALQLFMAMFNVHQAVEAIDVTFGTIVSCVLYGLVPFGLAYVEGTYWRLCWAKINPTSFNGRAHRLAHGDVKLRFLTWLYRVHNKQDDATKSDRGSIYKLFAMDERSQRNATVSQNSTDCYVRSLSATMHQLDVARVSLASRIKWHKDMSLTFQSNLSTTSVLGELHVSEASDNSSSGPSVTLVGAKNALWVQ
ncbi:hypothetical protein DYB26_011160, partial [Aphanomyces astaci]